MNSQATNQPEHYSTVFPFPPPFTTSLCHSLPLRRPKFPPFRIIMFNNPPLVPGQKPCSALDPTCAHPFQAITRSITLHRLVSEWEYTVGHIDKALCPSPFSPNPLRNTSHISLSQHPFPLPKAPFLPYP